MSASALSDNALRELADRIRSWAIELGFADAGISRVELSEDLAHLKGWLDKEFHGAMSYMARDPEMRATPDKLHPGTLSVISVRMPYWPNAKPAATVLKQPDQAYISRYALGRDYHKVLRGRLRKLAQRIEAEAGPLGYRVFSDSAPALEKAMARDASLGWIGKHSLLIRKEQGSWFFLGELYSDLPLPPDTRPAVENSCGGCQACMRACPTNAIVAPYTLDARRCISYLTIEHHGAIPEAFRSLIGNRIFGCDDCQLVCPWNRHTQQTDIDDFTPRHSLDAISLLDLWAWDEARWLINTEGMPIRRLNFQRWLRNLAVALGNAPKSSAVIAALEQRRDHPDPIVREHVQWALAKQGVPA